MSFLLKKHDKQAMRTTPGMRTFRTGLARSSFLESLNAFRWNINNSQRTRKLVVGFLAAAITAISVSFLAIAVSDEKRGKESANEGQKDSQSMPSSYEMLWRSSVPEQNSDMILYRHLKSQTEFLARIPLVAGEDDKTFGVSFRTLPDSSNGVAHVLEHSVFCGSKKYPLKDPLRHLREGSLQTYLNSTTYADRTVYALASRHAADFMNLIDVYLDAVFAPRAVEEGMDWIFRQEGWRVDVDENEHEVFDGIVMSEMLGVYSVPEYHISRLGLELLFPDTAYRHDFDGEPSQIVTLTRQEMIKFYNDYYHPTNAQMYVSGTKDDVISALDKADAYLSQYDARLDLKKGSTVQWQTQRLKEPAEAFRAFDGLHSDSGNMVLFSWLMNSQPLDSKTELGLMALNHLLMEGSSSVLQKALIDSKLGAAVIGGGLDMTLQQATFSVGLEGVTGKFYVSEVESVIFNTLEAAMQDGFTPHEIESAVNAIEFKLREFDSGSTPKAISVLLTVFDKWNYDSDPRLALMFDDALRDLKVEIAKSGSLYFVELIKSFFHENLHRAIAKLEPKAEVEQTFAKGYENRLNEIKSKMTADQYADLINESYMLKDVQSEDDPPEVIATIPTLSLSDLDRKEVDYPSTRIEDNAYNRGVTILTHEVACSSGVVYVDFGLDASVLDFEDAQILPLFSRIMTESGTESLSNVGLHRSIDRYTGGVWMEPIIDNKLESDDNGKIITTKGMHMVSMLFTRGKSTIENIDRLFDIFSWIWKEADFDSQENAISLLKELIAEEKRNVVSTGHIYAASRIKSSFSVPGFINEQINGLTNIKAMTSALDAVQTNWADFLPRLENMRKRLLSSQDCKVVLNLTGEKRLFDDIEDIVKSFLENLLPEISGPSVIDADLHAWFSDAKNKMAHDELQADEGIIVPTQISFVGKGGLMYKEGDSVPGSAFAICHFLETGYLWEKIRIENGASGVTTSLDPSNGVLTMTSNRDPNLVETLEVYDGAAEYLLLDISKNLSKDDDATIKTAIIGAIDRLDGMTHGPDQLGWTYLRRWLRGETTAFRQQWRDDIFNLSVEDFTDFARRLKSWDSPRVSIIGSEYAFSLAQSDQYPDAINILSWDILLSP